MTEPLAPQPEQTKTKSGAEPFINAGNTGFYLREFWQWSASDLVSNATRGVLAEFIVAKALGVANGVRTEWDPFDLTSPRGVPIEVKSCAYLQSWKQKKPSTISFIIKKKRLYNIDTNTHDGTPRRHADIYVFAVLAHAEKATLNPLDLRQWDFYPVLTQELNDRIRSQHSIGLNSLKNLVSSKSLASPVNYHSLAVAVEALEARVLTTLRT